MFGVRLSLFSPAADRSAARDLRDMVLGAIDGAVTTFAIVSGVAGAGLPPMVILALGFANVLADGFSMASGNYLATRAERDFAARARLRLEREMVESPHEAQAGLRDALERLGLEGAVLDDACRQVSARPGHALRLRMSDLGLEQDQTHPMRAALLTFAAFLAAGIVPLLPFVLGGDGSEMGASVGVTLAVFFGVGALKSRWSVASWWRSGLETLAVGSIAAGLAYAVGTLFG